MISVSNELTLKLNAIMEQLDLRQESKEALNRRRAARLNVRMPLNVYLTASGSVGIMIEVYTRNISSSGMGFVSRRPFKPDERLVIHFNVKDFPSRLILARAAYCGYCSAGLYEIGAEFLEAVEFRGPVTIPQQWLAHRICAKTEAESQR